MITLMVQTRVGGKPQRCGTSEFSLKDWPQMIEAIEEWLAGCLGTTKIPLAYVIRLDEGVKPDLTDLPLNSLLVVKELIICAPIRSPTDPGLPV